MKMADSSKTGKKQMGKGEIAPYNSSKTVGGVLDKTRVPHACAIPLL